MIASIKNVIRMYSQLLFCIAYNPFYWSCTVSVVRMLVYFCVLFASELVLSLCVWSPKWCPSPDSADTSLCLFVCRLLCVVLLHTQGHPELFNARYQITTTHAHTHLPRLQKHSQNFSDGCQVCAADGEKKERSRKCVECFCVLAQCANLLVSSQSYLNEAK